MKKVKKQLNLNLIHTTTEISDFKGVIHTYVVETRELIDLGTLECFVEVDEPETLSEFRNKHGISKDGLTEWLNKNYKSK